MGVKDDNFQNGIKKAVSRNNVKDLRISERKEHGYGGGENFASHKSGSQCPKSGCRGVLTQSISISAYKPWRYHCTSCASEFEYH